MRVIILALQKAVVYFVFSLTFVINVIAADTPPLVQYTGLLTDSNGNPLPDGSYKAVFNLYTVPTDGTPIWTEAWDFSDAAHPKIATQNGRFTVLLGNNTEGGLPPSVFQDNKTVYLGITVEADPEMLPRQRISSVPFALVAGDGVPRGGIIMWSGALGAIPEGWVLCDGQNGTPDLQDRFVVGAGNTYGIGSSGGNSTVTVPNHTHTTGNKSLSTNTSPNHTHTMNFNNTGGCIGDCSDGADDGGKSVGSDDHNHRITGSTHSGGAHTHSINAHNHTVGAAGTTSLENRPPYYALAYIMKL